MFTTNAIDSTSVMLANQLKTNRFHTEDAMERIASGKRINSASDDPAGLAISYRLDAQARGIEVGIRNAQDGISAAQILDAALVEIQNMAVRIKELSVQKGSGQFTESDVANVDAEITQLNAEMSRISGAAKFNTHQLSDLAFATTITGDSTSTTFQFPAIPTSGGTTVAEAENALEAIATARGLAGAYANRLRHAVTNLQSIAVNTKAALSRIVDADVAIESSRLAKGQVLQQSTASMLAQANASQQYVLELIRN